MRPPVPDQEHLDRHRTGNLAYAPRSVNAERRRGSLSRNCLGPCPQFGALPAAEFRLVITQHCHEEIIARATARTLATMGLPRLDCFGRVLRKGGDGDATAGIRETARRWLKDPKSGFAQAVRASVYSDFWLSLIRGKACVAHFRGLLWTIAERTTQRLGTRWATNFMRGELSCDGEAESLTLVSGGSDPELVLMAKEALLGAAPANDNAIDDPVTSRIVALRSERPPRPYNEISAMVGLSALACRQRFYQWRKSVNGPAPRRRGR